MTPISLTTRAFDPFVALEGAANFRDAGGFATAAGKRVRQGLLYRANHLSGLTGDDHAILAALDIRTIYDLRERNERERSPTRWPGPRIRAWSDRDHVAPWSEKLRDYSQDAAGMRQFLTDLNAELPHAFAARIAEIVRGLAAGDGACVIHCSAGKDRTGVVIGVLLALAGVPRDAIIAEYLLTGGRMNLVADQHKAFDGEGNARPRRLSDEAMSGLLSVDPGFLAAAFASIEARYGTLDGYAREGLGLDAETIAAFQAAVVEG